MSAEETVLTADSAHALAGGWLTPGSRRQPVFWLALLCAALVHAALIYGVSRSSPHYLGDLGGNTRAISVELVDAGALRGTGQQSSPAAAPPVPPSAAAPAAKPSEAKKPSEAAPDQKSAALPEKSADEALPAPIQPKSPTPAPAQKSKLAEKPEKERTPPKKKALNAPQQLDLSVPLGLSMNASKGRESSATRPPGITRSGANDRFGRGVIRALRKTMPPPETGTGRVTIRVFLKPDGNIEKLQLVQSSGDPVLDQSVLFSARQAAFPFPPGGATVADRTFRVTYVYR